MRLFTLLVAVILVGCASGWSAKDQGRHEWVQSRFPQALETLLPLDESATLSCRAHRDVWVETPEYLINMVDVGGSHGSVLVLVEPRRRSIWEQLLRAHRRNPDRGLEEILSGVELRTWRFTAATCAELAGLEGLDSRDIERAPAPDSITIHPMIRECLSSRGEVITITENLHQASVWLDRAYEVVKSCPPAGIP